MIPKPTGQAADVSGVVSGVGGLAAVPGPVILDGSAAPILWGNEEDEAIIGPHDFLRYFKETRGIGETGISQVAICCHNLKIFQDLNRRAGAQPVPAWLMVHSELEHPHVFECDGQKVAIAYLAVGAPAAAMRFEALIASGVKHFIIFGSAGSIDCGLDIGDFVIPREAIRDEGVSYHYLRPGRSVFASASILEVLERACERHAVRPSWGATWTTDAVFRETISKVQKYKGEGVLTVEMEASALYAIAKVRQVEVGHLLYVSDCLGDLAWRPGFNHEAVAKSHAKGFDIALEAVRLILQQNG